MKTRKHYGYVPTTQVDRNNPSEKRVIPRAVKTEYSLEHDAWSLTITVGATDISIPLNNILKYIKETEDEEV